VEEEILPKAREEVELSHIVYIFSGVLDLLAALYDLSLLPEYEYRTSLQNTVHLFYLDSRQCSDETLPEFSYTLLRNFNLCIFLF
jgi:hypothetical protein